MLLTTYFFLFSPTPSTSYEDTQNVPSQTTTTVEPVKPPQTNPEVITKETSPVSSVVACETSIEEINTSSAVNTSILNESKEKLKLEKKEKHSAKKLMKELAVCKIILEEMEVKKKIFLSIKNFHILIKFNL